MIIYPDISNNPLNTLPITIYNNTNSPIDFSSNAYVPTAAHPITLTLTGVGTTFGYAQSFSQSSMLPAPSSNMFTLSSGSPNVTINFLNDVNNKPAFTTLINGLYLFLLVIPNVLTSDQVTYKDTFALTT